MKRKKLYQILPMIMMGICVVGMCAVGTRIFAKKILIGKLGIENYITCTLADYNWGDRLERRLPTEEVGEKSEQLTALEEILAGAPQPDEEGTQQDAANAQGEEGTQQNAANAQDEEGTQQDAVEIAGTDGTINGTGDTASIADTIDTLLTSYSEKIFAAEDDINKYCNEKFPLYRQIRKISSGFDHIAGWNLAYARTTGTTYTLSTGYDYLAVEETNRSDYAEDIIAQKQIADQAGVDFLYVQYPYRVDEENSQVPWGAASYENQNVDAVLEQLETASVDVLDLRKELPEEGWSYNEGFYNTDGHWTTRSGFVSAGIVADYLNQHYGFSYEKSRYDESAYDVRSYSVNNYMVEEEVELFLPEYETELHVIDAYRGEEYRGSFEEACFDMAKADTEEYSSVLTAYSASRIRNSYLFEYQNLKMVNNSKRILITSDSFSWHLIPYLALDTEYVDYVYKMTPEQMAYYVEELKPDMVIVMDKPYY